MTETNKIPALSDIWSHFELGELTKLVTVLAVLAYATGVIAINTYLHGLGIVDFSFAKPKLLLTGILVLTSFLLLAVPPYFCAWSIASKRGQAGQSLLSLKRILILVFSFLGVLLLIAAPLIFKGRAGMGQTTVWEVLKCIKSWGVLAKPLTPLIAALAFYFPIVIGMVCVYWAKRLFDEERSEQPTPHISSRRFYLLLLIPAFFVVSTIGYICIFTYTFYSVIPQEFGGGQPYFQSFVVTDAEVCHLQQLGIPFGKTKPSNITQPLPVLHETDTLIAVWLDAGPSAGSKDGTSTVGVTKGKNGSGNWEFVIVELDKNMISATLAGDQSIDDIAAGNESKASKSWLPDPPPLDFTQCNK